MSLLDPSHPREKPCGGGVTPGAVEKDPELAELRSLGRPSSVVRMRGPRGARVLSLPIGLRPVLAPAPICWVPGDVL